MTETHSSEQVTSDVITSRLKKPGPISRFMDSLYGYDAFISYTRADDPHSVFASRLKALLDENVAGRKPLRCFLDAGDIPHDERLTRALTAKIRSSRFLIVLAGRGSLNHKWVCFEVQTALHFNRRVMVFDRGVDWPNCHGELKDLLPEHVQINCDGDIHPTERDAERICEQIGTRRTESLRKRIWRTVFAVLVGLLLLTAALWVRQIDLTQAESIARAEAEENFNLAKRIVDESFTTVEFNLKDVPGVAKYRLELLKKARDFYRDFLTKRKGDEMDIEYAHAIFNVGLVELELGKDAGPSFEIARDFLKQAAAEQPSNFEIRRLLFKSGLNTAITYINRERFEEAERLLRETVQLGGQLREVHPTDHELHLDYWLVYFSLGRTLANQSQTKEAQAIFEQALEGMQRVEKEVNSAPGGEEKNRLKRLVAEHLVGAHFNIANTPTVSLERRINAARLAWWGYETLASQYPTDHQLFFRTAQSCRLMADVLNKFGDAGKAQIFAERSLLIHRSLAKHYTGNQQLVSELSRDLSYIKTLPAWNNELWFHVAALKALRSTYERGIGTPEQQRNMAHRIALAHVQIAASKVQNTIFGDSPPPSTDAKLQAREHLSAAKAINDKLWVDAWVGAIPDSVQVMKLNIPMWLEFTR